MNVRKIREHSIREAVRLGYPVNWALPVIEAPHFVKPLEEVIDRLLCVYVTAACAYGLDRNKAQRWLQLQGVEDRVTPAERSFLEEAHGNPTDMIVQIEAIWALAWSISIVDELDFGETCSDSFYHMLPDLRIGDDATSLRSTAQLRPMDTLASARDLAYILHWGIREAQMRSVPTPGSVPPYVILERRRALEWLLSADPWDEVCMDT